MTQWLLDTLVYTGVLIALVLLLRKPVARHFGPQVAYALWALPLLRFVMPPIVLPASFAPAEPVATAAGGAEPIMIVLAEGTASAAAQAAPSVAAPVGLALIDLALALWIGGALLFLGWRAREYAVMRDELLADARPVGETGRIRLVETPSVASPVAFGIIDKVVALPPGFMAHYDLTARDMAIAHELHHHRGLDLIANVAAQPVLALHWFNPLALVGLASHATDQEAACDARVMAGRERSERAAYAQVIAGFAAGPNLALAAPMACPVLGEKSIIHRLRSLTMHEHSSSRKRLGIALIAGSALALPMTASISYAQPDPPSAPAEAPPAPAAPQAPLPPAPPAPPAPPEAPQAPGFAPVDREGHVRMVHVERAIDAHRDVRVKHKVGDDYHAVAFDEAKLERAMARMEAELERLDERGFVLHPDDRKEMREDLRKARAAMVAAHVSAPRVEMRCDGDEMVSQRKLEDGSHVIMVCERAAQDQARLGLAEARRVIENSRDLSDEQRTRALREIERHRASRETRKISLAPGVDRNPGFRSFAIDFPAPAILSLAAVRASIAPLAVAAARDCDDQPHREDAKTAVKAWNT